MRNQNYYILLKNRNGSISLRALLKKLKFCFLITNTLGVLYVIVFLKITSNFLGLWL